MSTKMFGREWQDEKLLEQFRENSRKILTIQLRLEDFEGNRQVHNEYSDEAFNLISKFREDRKNMEEKDWVIQSNKLLEELYNLIKLIGKEYFIIDEDGYVDYIWDYELLEKNKAKSRMRRKI